MKDYFIEVNMKILQILVLMFGLAVLTNAQNPDALFTIKGIVYDVNKDVIPKVNITFRYYDGQIFKTESFADGTYKLKIPFGKYTIEFYRNDFKLLIIEKFQNSSSLEKKLDVTMIGHCEDCGREIYGEIDLNKNKPIKIDFTKLENERNTAIVSGAITTEDGTLTPEIIINFVNKKGEEFKTKANTDGEYMIKLPFGVYQISAQLNENWKNKEIHVEVKNSENIQQRIVLICTANENDKCYAGENK